MRWVHVSDSADVARLLEGGELLLSTGAVAVARRDAKGRLFDLAERKFYLFGLVLWPQDGIYLALLLIAAALTEIAGSSDVVERGFVVYSNDAKTDLLGVPSMLIGKHLEFDDCRVGAFWGFALDKYNSGSNVLRKSVL